VLEHARPDALASTPVVSPSEVGLDGSRLEGLRAAIRGNVDDGRWPHAITIVARHGQICMLDVYTGKAESSSGVSKPLDPERSLFRIYSMTKPIIAAITLALVDNGTISLDDPLSKHAPEFLEAAKRGWPTLPIFTEGPKAAMRPAAVVPTVRHLLMHSAGIMALNFEQMIDNIVTEQGYAAAEPTERLRIMSQELAKLPLLHDPGEDFLYALQFDVLGRLLEAASGKSLEALLREFITEPCGMDSTFFRVPVDRRSDLRPCYIPDPATAYLHEEAEDATGRSLLADVSGQVGLFKTYTEDGRGYYGGSEGLISSAADFYRFAGMLLNQGSCTATGRRVLSEASVRQMTTNQLPGGGDLSALRSAAAMGLRRSGFGLGVSVAVQPSGGDRGIAEYNPFRCGVGEYGWGGAANTHYFASPGDGGLLVLFFTQVLQDPLMVRTGRELHRFVYSSVVKRN